MRWWFSLVTVRHPSRRVALGQPPWPRKHTLHDPVARRPPIMSARDSRKRSYSGTTQQHSMGDAAGGVCMAGFRCKIVADRMSAPKPPGMGSRRFCRPETSNNRRPNRVRAGLLASYRCVTRTICIEFVPPDTPESSPFVSITRSFTSTSCNSSSRSKIVW